MLKPGDTVDRYTLEAVLGEGGMGSVYRAHDERLDRHVALKVVRAPEKDEDEAARREGTARLVREARAAAKLTHPNAVGIYDVGEVGGTAFIAMELVSGKTLRALMSEGDQPLSSRIRWLADVARALSAAHRAGIVHRDVKPENVMVRPDGMVKVLDFGIARRASRDVDPSAPTEAGTLLTLTAAGINVGTPLYMAPEQIKSEPVDGRTDQFAWGVLAYELITGRVPWESKNDALALAAAILTQPAAPPSRKCPELGPEVEAVVLRALQKAPADRFSTMDDLLVALEGDRPATSAPPATQRTTSKPPETPVRLSSASAPPATPRGVFGAANDFRRYSTQTMRAIVERALERQVEQPQPGYTPDEILAAAREVGVDDETLRAAAREVAERRVRELSASEARQKRLNKLWRHAGTYVVLNLFFIFLMGWHGAKWIILFWGLGLAMSGVRTLFPDDAKDEKRGRRRRKNREPEPDPEVERAAEALLSTTSKQAKLRVAPALAGRRVSADTSRELEAEREAEAELERRAAAREAARRG